MVDYEGDYQRFVEKNEGEAAKMEEKESRRREIEKSQIKAKSKVPCELPLPLLLLVKRGLEMPQPIGASRTLI